MRCVRHCSPQKKSGPRRAGTLAATRQQLTGAEQRLAELEAERAGRLEQLAAHARADRALAAVLPPDGPGDDGTPAGGLRSMLDTMTTQLAEVDGALRDALAGSRRLRRAHARSCGRRAQR